MKSSRSTSFAWIWRFSSSRFFPPLLPFEPPYFEKAGLACTWVGHPVVAETPAADGRQFREKYAIAADTTLFCLLPGSRKSEVERHLPIFAQSLTLLSAQYPKLAIAMPVPGNVLPFVEPSFRVHRVLSAGL